MGRSTYSAEDICGWIESSLHNLTTESVTLAADHIPDGDMLCLRPRLQRLYLQNVDITKSAQAVITVDYVLPGEPIQTKLYRGQYTAMNWWGTDEEMRLALERAVRNCLQQIATDLANQPKQKAR